MTWNKVLRTVSGTGLGSGGKKTNLRRSAETINAAGRTAGAGAGGWGDEAWKRGLMMLLTPPSLSGRLSGAQRGSRCHGSPAGLGRHGENRQQAALGDGGGALQRPGGGAGRCLPERAVSLTPPFDWRCAGPPRLAPATESQSQLSSWDQRQRGAAGEAGDCGWGWPERRRASAFPGLRVSCPRYPGRTSLSLAAAANSRLAHSGVDARSRSRCLRALGAGCARLTDLGTSETSLPGRRQGARAQLLGRVLSTPCLPIFPTSGGLLTHITQLGMAISKVSNNPPNVKSHSGFFTVFSPLGFLAKLLNEGAVWDTRKAFMFSSMNQCCGIQFQSISKT
ncbi:uncharacterized protein LOC127548662 [Antechinus flavipes]|uniref:uncharacterized protein LOC127548662 n=1 Tax=Antechinus flavipes TaxID=38775 RepID=UPI0022365EA6|nr:uncharacterized protein LOC127548662 [Antechinus flavipes]